MQVRLGIAGAGTYYLSVPKRREDESWPAWRRCRELRELAVRGVDGPGMHIFDVLPDSWNHVEGE